MDVIIMPNLKKLIAKITINHPELQLTPGERFQFSPPSTLYFDPKSSEKRADLLLLHELGHYLIKKTDYSSDIELVKIESQAWAKAREICSDYNVQYNEDFAEDHLDSYRNWLHLTSLCKNCNLAGYQDSALLYHCPLCGATWKSRIVPE